MTTRKEKHEAQRKAARERRLPAAVPDVLVTCDREICRDEQGKGRFVELFRWSREENRWVARRRKEIHLRPDNTPTTDTVGWDGPASARSRWELLCRSCGHRPPANDAKFQAAFGLLQRQAEVRGEGGSTIRASLVLLEGMLPRRRRP